MYSFTFITLIWSVVPVFFSLSPDNKTILVFVLTNFDFNKKSLACAITESILDISSYRIEKIPLLIEREYATKGFEVMLRTGQYGLL